MIGQYCLQLTLGLGDGGEIYILPPERQPIKELKYRISTKVQQRIFSPEPMMNSEQKVDEMHVSPAIAKPNVSSIPSLIYIFRVHLFFTFNYFLEIFQFLP